MENFNQTVFDSDSYGGGLRWLLLFFRGGGAKGDTKIVPILHHMFENIKLLKGTIANSAQNIHNRY